MENSLYLFRHCDQLFTPTFFEIHDFHLPEPLAKKYPASMWLKSARCSKCSANLLEFVIIRDGAPVSTKRVPVKYHFSLMPVIPRLRKILLNGEPWSAPTTASQYTQIASRGNYKSMLEIAKRA